MTSPFAVGLVSAACILASAAPASALPGPHDKLRIMRDKTMQIRLGVESERVVKETAAAGFNVLSLPGHKDMASLRRRADMCARYGIGYLQWFRGTAHYGGPKDREHGRYVWPSGHVARLWSPNSDEYWDHMHKYIVAYAKMSTQQPAMMGVFLDFEPYDHPAWGMTYPLSYDAKIVRMFAEAEGIDLPALGPTERKGWIEAQGHQYAFKQFQIAHWRKRAWALREAVDEHNPNFVFCVYPALGRSLFLREVVGQAWGTEQAPLWSADPGNYGERAHFASYEDALKLRFGRVQKQMKWVNGLGIHVRYLSGLDPIGRLGDPEFFGKSASMISEASDGYWVFYEGPRFENKAILKPPAGDHRDYFQWFARANQAIIDDKYDFWLRPRETPANFGRETEQPQKQQFAGYSTPYSYSVTKLMSQHVGFETSHLVESWHLDALYLRNFDVVFLKNFNGGRNDREKARNELREHVRRGGSLLLNYDLRWFGESPFPEIAAIPPGRPPKFEGRLVSVAEHDALGDLAPGTKFKPYFPTYVSYEPGPQGKVLLADEQGRPVFVAGTFGKGRVVFAGHNYPRPSEVRNLFVTVPDDPELKGIDVFWHQKQPYPESVERDILLSVVDWLNIGRRWWDFEYDGSSPPSGATPPWEKTEGGAQGEVVQDDTATSGYVWRQRPGSRWRGFRLVEAGGRDVWRMPGKATIEVRFRYDDHEEPGVLFVNWPNQWQAVLEGADGDRDVLYLAGRNGNRYSIDEQWNILRLLLDDESITAYVLPGGKLRGHAGAWTKVAATEPFNANWLGYGPEESAYFHFGGNVDIDYVRWTHDRLVLPVVRARPEPPVSRTHAATECEPGPPRQLAWRDEQLVVTGNEPAPPFMSILDLINRKRFDEAIEAIEKIDPRQRGRDRAQLAIAVAGHPDSGDTRKALRLAREGLRHADPLDITARRLLHEVEVFEILPGKGMIPMPQLLPVRDTIAAGDVEGGLASARQAGSRHKKMRLFLTWSLAAMFEGQPPYAALIEDTEDALNAWAEAGAQGKDQRIGVFRRLLEQVKDQPWACMNVPKQSVLYPKMLRTWMRAYYWWWKQMGERQRPMSKKGFLEIQPQFLTMFPNNEAARIYGGQKIPWGSEFLPDEKKKRQAPDWAVKQQELRSRVDYVVNWWFRTRQRHDGLLEGHPEDDCEVLRRWSVTSFACGNRTIETGIRRLVDGIWNCGQLVDGYDRKMKDVEHSSEMSADTSLIIGLDYGDPLQFERFLQTTKTTADVHMAVNDHGHLHFRSISMSATAVQSNDVDTNYHGRAMRPAAMVAWYSGLPRAVELLHGWAKAWSEDTLKAGKTKPAGVMPAVVNFEDDTVDGTGNWTARRYGDLYMWQAGNHDMVIGKMLAAWMLTGDDSALDGLRAQFRIIQKYSDQEVSGAPEGSVQWAAQEMAQTPHFATWYRQCTLDDQFDDIVRRDTSGGSFFVTGDPADMAAAHAKDLGSMRYNVAMVTSEVRGMDRVDLRPWSLLGALTGSPVDVTQPPTFAVTWRDVGPDFAGLVRRFDARSFSAWVYSFAEGATNPRIQFWRLEPGKYELRLSADADMDGKVDGTPVQTISFEYQRRRDGVTFELPTQRICLVEVRQTKRLSDLPRHMPDLAIAPRDLVVPERPRSGQPARGKLVVHNIGASDGRDVGVRIVATRMDRKEAPQRITETTIKRLPYPADLIAKTETVEFTWTPPSTGEYHLTATVTDGSGVPEIYLGNNEASIDLAVE